MIMGPEMFTRFAVGCHIFKSQRFELPFTGLAPPHIHVYLHTGPKLSMSYVILFFMFSNMRWEMIVSFVDIWGIVDHHCLLFLFIILTSIETHPDHDNALWLYNYYCRYRRGKTDGDTTRQNTTGYLNDAFTNDYANIGKFVFLITLHSEHPKIIGSMLFINKYI